MGARIRIFRWPHRTGHAHGSSPGSAPPSNRLRHSQACTRMPLGRHYTSLAPRHRSRPGNGRRHTAAAATASGTGIGRARTGRARSRTPLRCTHARRTRRHPSPRHRRRYRRACRRRDRSTCRRPRTEARTHGCYTAGAVKVGGTRAAGAVTSPQRSAPTRIARPQTALTGSGSQRRPACTRRR